jgi:hypothetical protein
MHAIVWGLTLGQEPTCEILFLKSDEDPDHMVARVLLPVGRIIRGGGWGAARQLIDEASIEQLTEWRGRSLPIDRTSIGRS